MPATAQEKADAMMMKDRCFISCLFSMCVQMELLDKNHLRLLLKRIDRYGLVGVLPNHLRQKPLLDISARRISGTPFVVQLQNYVFPADAQSFYRKTEQSIFRIFAIPQRAAEISVFSPAAEIPHK